MWLRGAAKDENLSTCLPFAHPPFSHPFVFLHLLPLRAHVAVTPFASFHSRQRGEPAGQRVSRVRRGKPGALVPPTDHLSSLLQPTPPYTHAPSFTLQRECGTIRLLLHLSVHLVTQTVPDFQVFCGIVKQNKVTRGSPFWVVKPSLLPWTPLGFIASPSGAVCSSGPKHFLISHLRSISSNCVEDTPGGAGRLRNPLSPAHQVRSLAHHTESCCFSNLLKREPHDTHTPPPLPPHTTQASAPPWPSCQSENPRTVLSAATFWAAFRLTSWARPFPRTHILQARTNSHP